MPEARCLFFTLFLKSDHIKYKTAAMGAHSIAHMAIIVASVVVYIAGITFNILSAQGMGPFLMTTVNISDKYDTRITPSGWTFSIWGVIYFWLTAMLIYIVSTLFRKTFRLMYHSHSVLSYGFFICWILNILSNISWLLLWDREVMIAALIVLAFVAFTNYVMIFFSCRGLEQHGTWLSKYHNKDLWCIRILVQNGLALYATWTSVATLINLTIVVSYDAGMSQSDAATLSLSLLSIVVLIWFALEISFLDKHVRYILTVYPVLIVALSGNMTKNFDTSAPGVYGVFTALLLALACLLFSVKLCLVIWRHRKHPINQDKQRQEVTSQIAVLSVNSKSV